MNGNKAKGRLGKLLLFNIFLAAIICLVLPILGIRMAGYPLADYLHFPPVYRLVQYPEYASLLLGACLLLGVGLIALWLVLRRSNVIDLPGTHAHAGLKFPFWGWAGLALGAGAWVLAWNRFSWFEFFQPYTFTPLWVAYIVVVNAIVLRRSGRCPLLHETLRFLMLFPVSGCFWWVFEYFNRFAQNWVYWGVERWSVIEYFVHASISFSTVLPAVYSTRKLLETFPGLQRFFTRGPVVRLSYERRIAVVVLFAVALAFLFIGLYPQWLFPLLWTGPLFGWLALNSLAGRPCDFGGLRSGDWSYVLSWAFAALICGFFWEMWNFHSLAKWVYNVPYFHAFQLFEMPAAGYAGYLPFGLECALVINLVFLLLPAKDRVAD